MNNTTVPSKIRHFSYRLAPKEGYSAWFMTLPENSSPAGLLFS
jgi:hypothetical protein